MTDTSKLDLPLEVLNQYLCWLCGSEFPEKSDFDKHSNSSCRHISTSPKQNNSDCIETQEDYASVDVKKDTITSTEDCFIEEVSENNSVIKKHSCMFCYKIFTRKDHLKRHLTTCKSFYNVVGEKLGKRIAAEKEYFCKLCHKGFLRREHLRRHINTVCNSVIKAKQSAYVCFFCGNQFLCKDKLIRHIYATKKHFTIEATECFNCTLCGHQFMRKDTLQAHLRRHTDACLTCGKKLLEHISKQKNVKKYSCCLCSATFSNKVSLRKHLNFERDKNESYVCFLCSSLFTFKSNLEAHIINIHKSTSQNTKVNSDVPSASFVEGDVKREPLTCDFCNYVFLDEDEFVLHMKNHGTKNDFEIDLVYFKTEKYDES